MDDKTLDEILKKRAIPEPPSNLCTRIIDVAQSMPQDRPWYRKRFWHDFPVIDLRAPVLALAVMTCLMIGAVFVSLEQPHSIEDDVSLAFYVDDIVYMSEISL